MKHIHWQKQWSREQGSEDKSKKKIMWHSLVYNSEGRAWERSKGKITAIEIKRLRDWKNHKKRYYSNAMIRQKLKMKPTAEALKYLGGMQVKYTKKPTK